MARVLLLLGVVMCAAACPIPDDFVAVNNPPYVLEEKLVPLNTGVILFDCSQFPGPTADFSVANAVRDPDVYDDVSTMFYAWYVSTSETVDGKPVQKLVLREEAAYPLTCTNGNFVDGTNILTVYILDRDPVSTVDDAVKIAGPDGYAISVSWTIEVIR